MPCGCLGSSLDEGSLHVVWLQSTPSLLVASCAGIVFIFIKLYTYAAPASGLRRSMTTGSIKHANADLPAEVSAVL